MRKDLIPGNFSWRVSARNMRCRLLQKRSTGKTTECSTHLRHIAIQKYIFSELNRCIFQISLKYIKFIYIGLMQFEFLFQNYVTPPPPKQNYRPPAPEQNKHFWPPPPPTKTFVKFLPPLLPSWKGGGGGVHALLSSMSA